MKSSKVVCLFAVMLVMAGVSHAAEAFWDADNKPGTDGMWSTASNWWTNAAGGMPEGGPNGDFMVGFNHSNLVVCTLDTQVNVRQIKLAEGGIGYLKIVAGGSLTTAMNEWSGIGFGNAGQGTLEVDGGTFATVGGGGHLWIGGDTGSGSVGKVIVRGGGSVIIGQGGSDAQFGLGWSGGTGLAQVEDGLLWIANWHDQLSITAGSNMDITGGTVRIKGYRVDGINAMIADGRITGYGFADTAHVLVNWDAAAEETVITAIPEPATMMLLGLGGLALIRRKK